MKLPSDVERADFAAAGFLVKRSFLSDSALANVLDWTEELMAAPEVPGRQMVYHEDSLTTPGRRVVQRIENFCPFHAGFDQFIRAGELAAWAGALLGEAAVLFKDKINLKMPGGQGFKPHQDQQAGWRAYAPLFVTAMLSLDEATLENGCLELVGGRHREGLIGEEWQPLEAAGLGLEPIPTRPGDVIFFDSFVPHASGPNRTDAPRRILYVTYGPASQGDRRAGYFADKRRDFPPDIERDPSRTYTFRV